MLNHFQRVKKLVNAGFDDTLATWIDLKGVYRESLFSEQEKWISYKLPINVFQRVPYRDSKESVWEAAVNEAKEIPAELYHFEIVKNLVSAGFDETLATWIDLEDAYRELLTSKQQKWMSYKLPINVFQRVCSMEYKVSVWEAAQDEARQILVK